MLGQARLQNPIGTDAKAVRSSSSPASQPPISYAGKRILKPRSNAAQNSAFGNPQTQSLSNSRKRKAGELTTLRGVDPYATPSRPNQHLDAALSEAGNAVLEAQSVFDDEDFDDAIRPPPLTNQTNMLTRATPRHGALALGTMPPPNPQVVMNASPGQSTRVTWSSSPLITIGDRVESKKSHERSTIVYPSLPSLSSDSVAPTSRSIGIPKSSAEKRSGFPWPDEEEACDPAATSNLRTAVNEPQDRNGRPWDAQPRKPNQIAPKSKKMTVTVEPGPDSSQPNRQAIVKPKKIGKLFLSSEQRAVLDLIVENSKSVFFTGSAGTGKSVLLRELISELKHKYRKEGDRVAVTASTGLAACNVGGVTLHSFSGIGLGKESVEELVKKIQRNQKAKTRWIRTKVLVVDEISMVDGDLFDKLEAIAKRIRKNGRPFGGIQLVITGDFFQLPPVPDSGKQAKFCFEANTWPTSIHHTIGLTQVFRQKDANVLNEMRLGRLSPHSSNFFRKLARPVIYDDGIEATELFPTRQEVDRANATRMNGLKGEIVRFAAFDGGLIQDRAQRDKLLANCMAPAVLDLKLGAQVMLIKNMDEQLVNGSLGKVRGFMSEKTFEISHPTQSSPRAFELFDGDDEDSHAANFKKQRIAHPSDALDSARRWPCVRFQLSDGLFRDTLLQPESWKIELPNGEVQASRSQIPLIPAWALSIHKAQGQTLERVKVDLGKVFEKGQAYVALSRATCQEGLQVLRFDPRKVMAHEKVKVFYDNLYDLNGKAHQGSELLSKDGRRTADLDRNGALVQDLPEVFH